MRAIYETRSEVPEPRAMATERVCQWLLDGGRLRLSAAYGCGIRCYACPGREARRAVTAMTTKRPGEPVSMSLFFEFERRGWLRGLAGGQEFEAREEARAALAGVAARGWNGALEATPLPDSAADGGDVDVDVDDSLLVGALS